MSKTGSDRPFTEEELAGVPRVRPNIRAIRRKLGMSQAKFAEAYDFKLATLRDWEQGRAQPGQALCAYLKVIASKPKIVRKVLEPASRAETPAR